MHNGFFRVASCVPAVAIADCSANAKSILSLLTEAQNNGVELAVFPEMCITGYTCADLFHNQELLVNSEKALKEIVDASSHIFECVAVVGAPIKVGNALYNCAIAIAGGKILAIVPKSYLPNYNEFYERRWWQLAPQDAPFEISVCDQTALFGVKQLIEINGVKTGIEICEDLWTPVPPSSYATLAGAKVIANLSASDDLIGKYTYLKSLIAQQSARCICAYVYSSAGFGESSTDLVFDGKAIIAENGVILAANQRWQRSPQISICDVDILAIERDRMHTGTYNDCAQKLNASNWATIQYNFNTTDQNIIRAINPRPFVPPTDEAMQERCEEIINIQAAGLAKRLEAIHCRKTVVGISGGLDSTLALLVAVKAYDRLGYDRKGIIGITMPGFGTTARTKGNAEKLMEELGVTSIEIPIGAAVIQHFKDIGQNPDCHDVVYENSQARERTQILMDFANKENGIVLGTGDLSELALGWATYNGDHISMYGVNAGVPKTLVKYLVRYFANEPSFANARHTLLDIIDTPISPELIPADKQGNITQKTEDLVGPYDLHDFFLYYMLRYGFTPERVLRMAIKAFDGEFDKATILKWEKVFYKRFFSQQFKRSCLPDGPKVGSVCLSPRGDWRMPSDASSAQWLASLDNITV